MYLNVRVHRVHRQSWGRVILSLALIKTKKAPFTEAFLVGVLHGNYQVRIRVATNIATIIKMAIMSTMTYIAFSTSLFSSRIYFIR